MSQISVSDELLRLVLSDLTDKGSTIGPTDLLGRRETGLEVLIDLKPRTSLVDISRSGPKEKDL